MRSFRENTVGGVLIFVLVVYLTVTITIFFTLVGAKTALYYTKLIGKVVIEQLAEIGQLRGPNILSSLN